MYKDVDVCMLVFNDVKHDSRVQREASTLTRQGYKVVIIGMTMGKTDLPLVEEIDNYTVIRLVASRYIIPYYMTYQRAFLVLLRAASYARKMKAKVYHAHDFSGLLPLAFGLLWKKTFIYDSHELFFDRGIQKSFWDQFRPLERFMAQRAKAIITVNQSLSNLISEELNTKMPIVLRNCVDFRTNTTKPAVSYGTSDKKTIVHSGRLLYGRHILELVTALKYLPQQYVLVLMGNGTLESDIKDKAKQIGVSDRLKIVSPVHINEVTATLSQADIGVSLITSEERSYKYALPNKMFESIAAGLPILSSPNPELKSLIDKYDIGMVCDPTNPKLIAKTIEKMFEPNNYENFRRNVQKARMELNWEQEELKLIELYDSLIHR